MSTFTPNYDGHYRKVLFDVSNNVTVVQSAKRHGNMATTYQSSERNVNYSLRSSPLDRTKTLDDKSFVFKGVKFEGFWTDGGAMYSSLIRKKLELIPKEILAFLLAILHSVYQL